MVNDNQKGAFVSKTEEIGVTQNTLENKAKFFAQYWGQKVLSDAVENIAKDKVKLENEVIYWKNLYRQRDTELNTAKRAMNTYKGKFNRLKKLISNKEENN